MKTVFSFDKILSAGARKAGVEIDPMHPFAGLPAGFEQMETLYESEIKPSLADMEEERQSTLMQWRAMAIGGGIVLMSSIFFQFIVQNVFLGFGGFIAGMGLFGFGFYRLSVFSKKVKDRIVSPIVSALGLTFDADPAPQASLGIVRDLKLIGGWDRSVFRDEVTGVYKDVDFLFYETCLTRESTDSKGNKTTTTVFDGQIMVFDFHKPFAARTVLQRDKGILNRFQKWGQGGLEKVALESTEFEKAFEVYSGDQVEARFILTPKFMQSLLDLESDFHGKNVNAGFEQGKIYITLQGADMFEPGKMSIPLDSGVRVRVIIDDFLSIFRVIDAIRER